jgi:hypothetical protein
MVRSETLRRLEIGHETALPSALFFARSLTECTAPQLAPLRACTETDGLDRHCVQAWDDSARGEAAEGVARRAA